MHDDDATSKMCAWKARSAEETVAFLSENFGPDGCDHIALITCMMNVAAYEKRPNDALFWSTVFARRERLPLSQKTRRELQDLLEDSMNWDA